LAATGVSGSLAEVLMAADRRPEAGLKRPTIAGGGFKVFPVEHLFRFVEVRHGVDFIPVSRVEEDRFEGKRAVGNPFVVFNASIRTAASSIYLKDGTGSLAAAPNLEVY
jgi:hypothetical protein